MTIDSIISKINRYLQRADVGPMIVDVQNHEDLMTLVTHFHVGNNQFVSAQKFCQIDEAPQIETILDYIAHANSNVFISDLSPFLMLKGEKALLTVLGELLSATISGHVVLLLFQCKQYLEKIVRNDRRLLNRICVAAGNGKPYPALIFVNSEMAVNPNEAIIHGLHQIAFAIEEEMQSPLYVKTKKRRSTYPYSLIMIADLNNSFAVLTQRDPLTTTLSEEYGTEEQWDYALQSIHVDNSWNELITKEFGSVKNLDLVLSGYCLFDEHKKWLYFIALKLYGAKNNQCLNQAVNKATESRQLVRELYRGILEIDPTDDIFAEYYQQRKVVLAAFGNPINEATSFCSIVRSKGKDAIYYLTDGTEQEKELVFELISQNIQDYDKDNLIATLQIIYPSLWKYLSPYDFHNALLDEYFQQYKFQKVINRVLPEFETIVTEQATRRDYNSILQPRSVYIESMRQPETQTYFVDAMGVEYLGYIMEKCREANLSVSVTVCRCELPSITSMNKEFADVLSTDAYPLLPISDIDDIKHHGKDNVDYSKTKLPVHLIHELKVLDTLLDNIKSNLTNNRYQKAILISDHGASRLAVIHETESLWEMATSGIHSGRCCMKSEVDTKPDFAVDAGSYWSLANYDRFKGSRKANIEVHGGATLEEVVVPIIEISNTVDSIEIRIMPIDAPASYSGIPEISVSYRKKAAIKVFATQKLSNVRIRIDGHYYDATPIDDYYYVVSEMPEIKRAKQYNVDVYASGKLRASNLPLLVKKESGTEKSIL